VIELSPRQLVVLNDLVDKAIEQEREPRHSGCPSGREMLRRHREQRLAELRLLQSILDRAERAA
jgi:hypothetical protein